MGFHRRRLGRSLAITAMQATAKPPKRCAGEPFAPPAEGVQGGPKGGAATVEFHSTAESNTFSVL